MQMYIYITNIRLMKWNTTIFSVEYFVTILYACTIKLNLPIYLNIGGWVRVMVFKATFNNISFISWRFILLVEKTRVPEENHRPAASH